MKVTYIPPPEVTGRVILELTEEEAGLIKLFADFYFTHAYAGTNAARRLGVQLINYMDKCVYPYEKAFIKE